MSLVHCVCRMFNSSVEGSKSPAGAMTALILRINSGIEIPTPVGHTCPLSVNREGQTGIPVCRQSFNLIFHLALSNRLPSHFVI